MKELNVNSELESIFLPLPSEVYAALETSIIKDGLLSPIVVWSNTIIDGHNRYKICRAHNIEFDTISMNFDDIEYAKLWIFEHQNGRRNLTDYSRCISALKMKPALTEKAQQRMKAGGNPMPTLAQGGAVRDEIAKIAGVSHGTLEKAEEIDNAATDEIKAKLQSGKMSINAAHKTLKVPADRLKVHEALDIPILRKSIRMLKNAVDDICDSWGDLSDQELVEAQSNADRLNDQIESAHAAAQPALDALESAISY